MFTVEFSLFTSAADLKTLINFLLLQSMSKNVLEVMKIKMRDIKWLRKRMDSKSGKFLKMY